ncbi:hypothetical protein DPMN_179421 [Dreissena polymorpha]|uniref:Uncharacterized protein n=1 Tax=Dreissena polymorpha TaxID=45954 RepID=A0A9D4EEH7_DREPO|nr:hypothetical protein DPMN_179421 [Dreissena polymorpha]
MKDAVLSIKGSITSFIHKCAILQNELTQFYSTIQKIGDNKELYLIATIKCENKIQQALTVLGKADHVFTVQGMSVHNVKIQRDLHTCHITGCCVLSEEQVLIVDNSNNKVKLLNEQYQVVSHCCVTAKPLDVCQITPSEVAVTVDDGSTTHEIQFITVINSQLVIGRKFQLKHECTGIAHHDGDLFVTSGRELYKYSLSGKGGCMLYHDHVQFYISNFGKAPYIYTLFQDSLGPSTGKNHRGFILISLEICITK